MLRQAPGRNQRAKGFRLKHALQIGILVAICIWLLYQVKHSHENKRAYDAQHTKAISKPVENQDDFFNFGRKDLTRTEEAGTASEIHKEEESEETQEEEEEEPEIKQEETEDEVKGAGNDGIDEHDQENADEETEKVEDLTEDEEKEGQMDETDQLDSQDHEVGTQAREENYKRDDASSAVVHDTRATESDSVTVKARSMDEEKIVDDSKGDDSNSEGYKVDLAEENLETREMETENMVNRTVDGYQSGDNGTIVGSMNNRLDNVKDNDTLPDDNHANNATAADSKEAEDENSKSENGFVTNSTIAEEKIQTDSLINTTAVESDNLTELSANSTTNISDSQTEGQTNSTVEELPSGVQMSNSTVGLDSARDQNTAGDKETLAAVDKETLEDVDSTSENIVNRDEKPNPTAALDSGEQSTSSSTNGNEDVGQRETDDLSHAVMEEERETRMDLSTLPNIENEANSMEDEAAE